MKLGILQIDLDLAIFQKTAVGILNYRPSLLCSGLKQSPRQWYKRFDGFIRGKKYTRSHYDPCVYYNKLPTGEYIYLLLYVDDMLIASKSRSAIDTLRGTYLLSLR